MRSALSPHILCSRGIPLTLSRLLPQCVNKFPGWCWCGGPSPTQQVLAARGDPLVRWRGSARTLPAGAAGPVTRSTTPRVTRVPVVIPTARWWWQALHRPAWQPACSHGDRGHSTAYRHPWRAEGDWEVLRARRMGKDPAVLGLTPGVTTDRGWVLDLRTGMWRLPSPPEPPSSTQCCRNRGLWGSKWDKEHPWSWVDPKTSWY